MDNSTAEDMLSQLDELGCPFVCDVDASYLSQLLLVPSQHRMHILSWLFSKADRDIENEIEAFHRNPDCVASSADVDKETQLLTRIGSSLGLCSPTDYSLIKGKESTSKHLALWRNLITIATELSKENGSASIETVDRAMEVILRTCDVTSCLSNNFHVLPPAVEKELDISLKTAKFSNSNLLSSTSEIGEKLEILQKQLDNQLAELKALKESNPNLSTTTDDPILAQTVNRSLTVTLNDLAQLQTSFLQVFDNHFEPYCDKEPVQFTRLGSTIHSVSERLSQLLNLFENLKKLKESHQVITNSRLLVT